MIENEDCYGSIINVSIVEKQTRLLIHVEDNGPGIPIAKIEEAVKPFVRLDNSRNLNKDETIFCGTRYGNVMGSRGSVIPLFIEQIKSKDSRKKVMKLTEKGYKILDEAIPLWLEAEDQILNQSKKFGFSVI